VSAKRRNGCQAEFEDVIVHVMVRMVIILIVVLKTEACLALFFVATICSSLILATAILAA
jgi:hypothetical protein